LSPPRVDDARLDSAFAAPLVAALAAELLERYGVPDADPDGLTADHLAPPTGAFVVVWQDGQPVACGGLRRYDTQVGELKRMFVTPPMRGHGLSRLVLAELETRASALGYERLVLETGVRQPEAMRLYETSGYTPIEPYGFYRSEPMSRCYAKRLGSRGAPGGISSGRTAPAGSSDPGTPPPR
jgi:GNAT superfamily N-acetyltransferase